MHNDSLIVIKDILEDYSDDIQEGISKDAQEVAKKGVQELRATSPKRKGGKGEYSKGWKVNTDKSRDSISCIIHNSTNYQLTHLLEKGHRIINRKGEYKGDVKAYVHIAPVEEKCINEYQKAVESTIKNGG